MYSRSYPYRHRSPFLAVAALIGAALVTSIGSAARAQSLNIDFGGAVGSVASTFGAAAGQVGTWNLISTPDVTPNLLGLNGVATAVSLNLPFSANLDLSGSDGLGVDPDIDGLRGDNFFMNSPSLWSFELDNLVDGAYDVYVYSPTNPGVSTGDFTVNAIPVANISGNEADTLVEGEDWVKIPGVVTLGGKLFFQQTGFDLDHPNFAGIAGVQIVTAGSLPPTLEAGGHP